MIESENSLRANVAKLVQEGTIQISKAEHFDSLLEVFSCGILQLTQSGYKVSNGFLLKIRARFEILINEIGESFDPSDYLKSTNPLILDPYNLSVGMFLRVLEDILNEYNLSTDAKLGIRGIFLPLVYKKMQGHDKTISE